MKRPGMTCPARLLAVSVSGAVGGPGAGERSKAWQGAVAGGRGAIATLWATAAAGAPRACRCPRTRREVAGRQVLDRCKRREANGQQQLGRRRRALGGVGRDGQRGRRQRRGESVARRFLRGHGHAKSHQ